MNHKVPTLAVFDAGSPPSLSLVRSLGRRNIPFCVYSHERIPLARLSKYTNHFERCPDSEDPSQFSSWLENKLKTGEIRSIAPTSDMITYYIAVFSHLFPDEIRAQSPAPERILDVIFKDRFQTACKNTGLEMPEVHLPLSVEEARDVADTLTYPVILKPKSHVVAGLRRGKVVKNAAQLRITFAPYDIAPTRQELLQRYPEQRWPMIQERLEARPDDFVSISGILDGEGMPIATSASVKDGQWPPDLGVGTSFKCFTDEQTISIGISIVQQLIQKGLYELELVFDRRRNQLIPIDLNPRLFGQVALDVARGNDLPWLWYQLMCGESVSVQPAPKEDIEWRHTFYQPLHAARRLKNSPARIQLLQEMLSGGGGRYVDVIHDTSDPLPTLLTAAIMARYFRSTVRLIFN